MNTDGTASWTCRADPDTGRVWLMFEKPVDWMRMAPDVAEDLARAILECVPEAREIRERLAAIDTSWYPGKPDPAP